MREVSGGERERGEEQNGGDSTDASADRGSLGSEKTASIFCSRIKNKHLENSVFQRVPCVRQG